MKGEGDGGFVGVRRGKRKKRAGGGGGEWYKRGEKGEDEGGELINFVGWERGGNLKINETKRS